MGVGPTSGSKVYIADPGLFSPTPTWVEIGEVVNIGEFGRVYGLIQHNSIGNRGTRKFKGNYNDGALTLQLGRDASDAGQAKLVVAVDSDEDYLFKIELNDASGASGSVPTNFQFEAKVMSYTANPGGSESIVGSTAQLEIKSGTLVEDPGT